MRTLKRCASLLLLAYALSACSSESAGSRRDAGEREEEDDPDAGEEQEPLPELDAGTTPSPDPVPLTVWVDDLIEHRTTDEAEPDTVDDKVIRDDTDETSFNKYLP